MTPQVYKMIKDDLKAGKIDGEHVAAVTAKLAEFEKNCPALVGAK